MYIRNYARSRWSLEIGRVRKARDSWLIYLAGENRQGRGGGGKAVSKTAADGVLSFGRAAKDPCLFGKWRVAGVGCVMTWY